MFFVSCCSTLPFELTRVGVVFDSVKLWFLFQVLFCLFNSNKNWENATPTTGLFAPLMFLFERIHFLYTLRTVIEYRNCNELNEVLYEFVISHKFCLGLSFKIICLRLVLQSHVPSASCFKVALKSRKTN